MKKCLLGIGCALALLAISRSWWLPTAYVLLGYYITVDEVQLAEKLYREKRPASDCHKLIHFDSFAPPVGLKRLDCIVQYAKIARDPTICERLMPSEFGVHCVENILPPAEGPSLGLNCENRDRAMRCYSSYDALLAQKQDVIIDFLHCESISDMNKRDWCYIGRVQSMPLETDCSKVAHNQDHKDFCVYAVAMKTKNRGLCGTIQHPIRRSACEVLLRGQ